MFLLYFINVFFFIPVYLYILYLYRIKYDYPLYSIPTFIILLTIPVLLLKRTGSAFVDLIKIDNPYFQFSILMDNVQLLIVLAQTIILIKYLSFFEKLFFKMFSVFKIFNLKKIITANSNYIFYLTLLFYAISFLILTNTNTNTILWILNPRDGYQFAREGAGVWYAFSIIFLGVNSTILFIYRTKELKFFFINVILYSYLWYLFGGKAYIISFFLLVLLSSTIHFDYRITRKIFKTGISFVFMLILFLFFNNGFNLSLTDSVDSIFSYFDHYYYSSLFYEDVFKSNFNFFNGEIFITNFYKYIPRSIFQDKPYVYGSVLLNEIYLPGYAELGHTPEFAGQASYYADFGLAGVVIYNILDLNFLIKTFFFLLILKNARNKEAIFKSYYFAPAIFSFAPAFSQFISFPFDILLLIFFSIFFSLFYKKREIEHSL
jgi:hypothetical protein